MRNDSFVFKFYLNVKLFFLCKRRLLVNITNMYKIKKREMTFDDFMVLKKKRPCYKWRANAKTINFSAIFACSGPALGSQMRAANFNEAEVDESLGNFHLEDEVNKQLLASQLKGYSADKLTIKYNVLGIKIRELFFNLYHCLLERTEREQAFAKQHGYVRAWTGPVRHLMALKLMKKNANGEVAGADAKLHKSYFTHECNDATNSPVQTAEVYQAMPDVTSFTNMALKIGLRSRVFNFVHDSFEMYVFKPERDLVYAYLNYLASVHRQPYFNIPMHIDIEESDLDKGETFREGREINIEKFDVKEELQKWCDKFGKHFTFDDIDAVKNGWIPLHGVLDTKSKVGIPYIPRKANGDFEII